MLEKLTGLNELFELNWLTQILGHCYTMFLVMIGWVVFNSASVSEALQYIGDLFKANSSNPAVAGFWWRENFAFFVAAAVFSTPVSKLLSAQTIRHKQLHIAYPILMMLLFIVTISFIVKSSYNPFIYFNF